MFWLPLFSSNNLTLQQNCRYQILGWFINEFSPFLYFECYNQYTGKYKNSFWHSILGNWRALKWLWSTSWLRNSRRVEAFNFNWALFLVDLVKKYNPKAANRSIFKCMFEKRRDQIRIQPRFRRDSKSKPSTEDCFVILKCFTIISMPLNCRK